MFKKNYIIFLFLTLFSSFPFQLKCTQEEPKLLKLIDQIVKAERYWQQLQFSPFTRLLTRTPSSWVYTNWKTEIQDHLKALQELKQVTAKLLGKCKKNQNCSDKTFKELYSYAGEELLQHGIPDHFRRNWLKYSCAAAALIATTYKIKSILNKDIIASFNGSPEQYQSVWTKLSEHKPPLKFSRTTYGNHHIIRAEKEHQAFIEQTLRRVGISQEQSNFQIPTVHDTLHYCYDDDGNNYFKLFFNDHVLEPITNLWYKIFKRPVKRTILTYNTDDFDTILKTQLEDVAQTALEEGHYKNLFGAFENSSKKLREGRDLDELRQLRDGIREIGMKNGITNSILSDAIKGSWKKSTPAFFKAWNSLFEERNMQASQVSDNVAIMIEKQNLTIEFIALMPAALLAYCAYKGVKSTLNKNHQKNVINPLTQDLKDFETLLDKYKTETTDAYFDGMQMYWAYKLQKYAKLIDSKQRMYFDRDLKRITSGISPEHQQSIIFSILHYGIAHF